MLTGAVRPRSKSQLDSDTTMLWLRAALYVLLLPGVFAGVIPALLLRTDAWRQPPRPILGLTLLALGALGFAWCVCDFAARGRGTLAYWDPPRRLVVDGLYRCVRNPMYVSLTLLLAGWAFAVGSPVIAAYAVFMLVAFNVRVLLYEEPMLARSFPADWPSYSANVPRWIPKLRANTVAGR
jgi:protein-S-isoprenylcysteine O-methyltransferase Ste14